MEMKQLFNTDLQLRLCKNIKTQKNPLDIHFLFFTNVCVFFSNEGKEVFWFLVEHVMYVNAMAHFHLGDKYNKFKSNLTFSLRVELLSLHVYFTFTLLPW